MRARSRLSVHMLETRDNPTSLFATSNASGVVTAYDSTTFSQLFQITPFPSVTGPVSVATVDVNGDSTPDIITTGGAGAGPVVNVYNGLNGTLLKTYEIGDSASRAGASVVSAGKDSSGNPLLLVGSVDGGLGTVHTVNASTGVVVDKFVPFAGFSGTLSVASADVDKDGISDIIVGAGAGGAPRFGAFSGVDRHSLTDGYAFETTFTGGVTVTSADVNGDGSADVIVSAGKLGGPRVRIYSSTNWQSFQDFFAFDSTKRDGVLAAFGTTTAGGTGSIVAMNGSDGSLAAFNPTTVASVTAPTYLGIPGAAAINSTAPTIIGTSPPATTPPTSPPPVTVTDDSGMATSIPQTSTGFTTLSDGVKIKDDVTGSGTAVTSASSIKVFYTGWLTNGTVFDQVRSPSSPTTFQLTGLIKGWQSGLLGMQPGGIRTMYIPASLAYGAAGAGTIPPNADLVFQVKLASTT